MFIGDSIASSSESNLGGEGVISKLISSAWLENNRDDYCLTTRLVKKLRYCESQSLDNRKSRNKHNHEVIYPRIKSESEIQELASRCYRVISQMHTHKAKFHRSWGMYLKKEMTRESDCSAEALYGGVCLAYDYRILFKVLMNPGIQSEELELELEISPTDRFHQASYLIHESLRSKEKIKDDNDWRPFYFKKSKIVGEILFESLYNPDKGNFENLFDGPFDRLKLSEGWFQVHIYTLIGGHAILVRWDDEKQHYWIIDSAIGFFCFDEASHSVEKAERNCMRCLRQLLSAYYPFTYKLKGCAYYVS